MTLAIESSKEDIIEAIRFLSEKEGATIVAIDGRCGSGKTTLAAQLSDIFDCTVFHMDDFFLQKEQRTPKRISTPGEFVDHERFLKEVLLPIKEGKTVYLRKFCHETFMPGEATKVDVKPLVIVEGSYSCNAELKPYYDMTIFVTTDADTQIERIKFRNPTKIDMFIEKWIPLEELYFDAFSTEKECNLIYRT